jgi:hypothetical protein
LDCNVARIPAPRATRGNITAHVQTAATYCRKVQRLNHKHISAFGSIRKSSLLQRSTAGTSISAVPPRRDGMTLLKAFVTRKSAAQAARQSHRRQVDKLAALDFSHAKPRAVRLLSGVK